LKAPVHLFLTIDNDQLGELVSNVEGTSEERCGFLLGHDQATRIVTAVVPALNVAATDRHMRFEIDPLEYLRAEQYAAAHQLELVGIYHSHPNTVAIPSETDRREAYPHFSYVILSVMEQRFADIRSWRLNQRLEFEEETVIHFNI
jgi:proteasome lid subunit RPN8/RPN11